MDISYFLQRFESNLASYTGDDPLEQWQRFVDHLEQRLPADGCSEMSLVFDTLVQRFINVPQYANDIRYVNYCIKCAGYYTDPISLYSHVFNRGIGTRTAALYVAWAQQFEQRGMNEQAAAVYQKAVENQAQPEDAVLHEYRQFQTRTTGQASVPGSRNPLQSLNLTNQPVAHLKESVDCPSKPEAHRMTVTISRSETSGMIRSSQACNVQLVSEYMTDELHCEGSELCFEEVRAAKYFQKLREQQEEAQRKNKNPSGIKYEGLTMARGGWELPHSQTSSQRPVSAVETTSIPDPFQQTFQRPPLGNRRSISLRLLTEPAFIQEANPQRPSPTPPSPAPSHHASVLPLLNGETAAAEEPGIFHSGRLSAPSGEVFCLNATSCPPQDNSVTHQTVQPQEAEEKLDASHGDTANLSHVTPNNSLGFAQATPSRGLPSPTVNTREALNVIMDMFQTHPFINEPFNHSSTLPTVQREEFNSENGDVAVAEKPPAVSEFAIFQDGDAKKTPSTAARPRAENSLAVRTVCEDKTPKPDKPNETSPDLMADETAMWGARYNSCHSLAACPNSTTDFAMQAPSVSTPFTKKIPSGSNNYLDKENNCDVDNAEEDVFLRRQTKKLSPIIEQSPNDDKLPETSNCLLPSSTAAQQGTIVGEGVSLAPPCLVSSSITMVQPPPPAVLSFRDHTLCPADSWEVPSPERPPAPVPPTSTGPGSDLFEILKDPDPPASPILVRSQACNVPMSPECPFNLDWMSVRSPEAPAGSDLDAFVSPRRIDVPMSPEQPQLYADVPMSPEQPQLYADVPMSPQPVPRADEPMTSPDRESKSDVSTALRLVSDPWDEQLISQQLSALSPPLTSHPHYFTWQCNVPNLNPRTTISMGKLSFQIDGVVGQGAFATVYQVTNTNTCEKMVLKVQKPASPWEFYMNSQLDARLQPDVRRLYSSLHSAHLFHNGSVLLGELHKYGTLLNVVNIYRTLSDKVMPQPLVMYFTVCILHMVEQLHSVRIVHADIKPDNFLLGDRFLENKSFESESCDHGLVLIDLGQSIDMELFPQGTAFTNKCLTSGFQCTEMLSGKPWNYQTDYFGLAGTVYCMLFGTYMQVTNSDGVWKTNGTFRRKPHGEMWQDFFHTLLNVPHCHALPSLRSLRQQLSAELQQNYGSKLASLKSRLVMLLLENHKAPR